MPDIFKPCQMILLYSLCGNRQAVEIGVPLNPDPCKLLQLTKTRPHYHILVVKRLVVDGHFLVHVLEQVNEGNTGLVNCTYLFEP